MAAMITTRMMTFSGNDSAALEIAIMMRVSIGSLALPRSLYMSAKIGMRKRTMPMRTMMANEPMRIG